MSFFKVPLQPITIYDDFGNKNKLKLHQRTFSWCICLISGEHLIDFMLKSAMLNM